MSEIVAAQGTTRTGARRLFFCLIAVFAVLYLPWLAVEPPIVGLESTRILVAREMVRSGDWIVPTQNGITYLAKPPVGYWLFALGSAPFGEPGVVSARLVSALCTLLLSVVVALFARRELGARVGLLAGLCVLGTGLFIEKGMRAEIETSFALFTSLAILAAFRGSWAERGGIAWSLLAGAALGAALLIKGPVAALIFVLALAGFVVAAKERRRRALALGSVGLVVGVSIGAAWLLALVRAGADGADFQRLVDEAFQRFHHAGVTNAEPWWFYAPALLGAFLPATLLLPSLFARRSPARPHDERQASLFGLLVGWSLLSLVALSASQGKEARYMLPTIPGWALLAAWGWYRPDPMPWLASWRRLVGRSGLWLAWIVPLGLVVAGWKLRPAAWPWILLASALAVLALRLLLHGRRTGLARPSWAALLVGILAVRIFWAAVPMANRNDRYPIAKMGQEIAAHLAPGEPLVQLGEYCSYVQLQVDRPFRLALDPADVACASDQEPHSSYVLARTRHLAPGEEDDWIEVASWPFGKTRFHLLRKREDDVAASDPPQVP